MACFTNGALLKINIFAQIYIFHIRNQSAQTKTGLQCNGFEIYCGLYSAPCFAPKTAHTDGGRHANHRKKLPVFFPNWAYKPKKTAQSVYFL